MAASDERSNGHDSEIIAFLKDVILFEIRENRKDVKEVKQAVVILGSNITEIERDQIEMKHTIEQHDDDIKTLKGALNK